MDEMMDGVDIFTARLLECTSSDDVEALKDLGVDKVTSYRDKHNSSALHYAAGYGAIQTCQWLLDCGMDPATPSRHNGRTPLHWAARNGHSETCGLLIGRSHGAVDLHAKGQVTPLQLAVWQGHLDTCRLLVSLGANPLFLNGWGCGTAHWLAKCPNHRDGGHVRSCCVWLFEDCRVPCNEQNYHGQTPLHKAAFEGNLPVLEYLVEDRGILDSIVDHQGNTAADCAERNRRGNVAVWIRRYASPIRQGAMNLLNDIDDLDSQRGKVMPSVLELRRLYLQKSKKLHPDRRRINNDISIESESQSHVLWSELQQAYELLMNWWRDPELYDLKVRLRSRNSALIDRPALLWFSEWHMAQPPSTINPPALGPYTSTLSIFERRLVSLLLTDAHRERGLRLAQLPKEFEKSWGPAPKPHDFKCRKWIDVLQRKLAGTISVEIDPNGIQSPLVFAKLAAAKP